MSLCCRADHLEEPHCCRCEEEVFWQSSCMQCHESKPAFHQLGSKPFLIIPMLLAVVRYSHQIHPACYCRWTLETPVHNAEEPAELGETPADRAVSTKKFRASFKVAAACRASLADTRMRVNSVARAPANALRSLNVASRNACHRDYSSASHMSRWASPTLLRNTKLVVADKHATWQARRHQSGVATAV